MPGSSMTKAVTTSAELDSATPGQYLLLTGNAVSGEFVVYSHPQKMPATGADWDETAMMLPALFDATGSPRNRAVV